MTVLVAFFSDDPVNVVVVVGLKTNCPHVGPGPTGGVSSVGGLSKGS